MNAKANIIPIFVPHAGCENACIFCNQRHISSTLDVPDGNKVEKIISDGLSKISPKTAQAAFYGGSFTAIPESLQSELLSAVTPFIDNGKISGIRISTRPDCIDITTLERLKKYGVDTIELGAQSMDDYVLSLSHRGHTADDIKKSAKLIKEYGFSLVLQVMCGLPGDRRDVFKKTAEEIINIHPDGVRIYPVVVIKDTELYELYKEGKYKPLTPDEGAEYAADMLEMLEGTGIVPIRVGLNPSDELEDDGAVCGAYHPALGEMAKSKVMLRKICHELAKLPQDAKAVTIAVPKSKLSIAIGQKRCNIEALNKQFPGVKIKIIPHGSGNDELIVKTE